LSVVAIGGSTTECSALNNGKDWPALTNASLHSKFSKLWLNNAGFGGHSTFGHLYLKREYVSSISPKVILYLVGINDVLRSSENPGTTLPNNKHPYLLCPLPLVLADNTEIGMIGLNLLRLGKAYLLGYEPIPVIGKRERVFLGTDQPATINPVALKK
jgi:hypothetical protein